MRENINPEIDELIYKQLSIFNVYKKNIKVENLCYYLLDAFNVYREVNGFPKLTMQEFIDSQPTVKHDGSGPLIPDSFLKEMDEALARLVKLGLVRQTNTGDYELAVISPSNNPMKLTTDNTGFIDIDRLDRKFGENLDD